MLEKVFCPDIADAKSITFTLNRVSLALQGTNLRLDNIYRDMNLQELPLDSEPFKIRLF